MPKTETLSLIEKARAAMRELPGIYQTIGKLNAAIQRCSPMSVKHMDYEERINGLNGKAAELGSTVTLALRVAEENGAQESHKITPKHGMSEKPIKFCAYIKCSVCGKCYLLVTEREEEIWEEADRLGWVTEREVDESLTIVGKCPEHVDTASLSLPWTWADGDAEFASLKGHEPDWYLEDAKGKCILWGSCPSGDPRDVTIGAEPGVMEFIKTACNEHHDLRQLHLDDSTQIHGLKKLCDEQHAEIERLKTTIEQLKQVQRKHCCG